MEYSRMTTIELHNFMSFEKAKFTFDETGILNLKGYNDSGKSAVLRALAVCLMDRYKRNQVKFIRDNCEYFRVVVSFDDGVSIIRDKYSNGQSLYELRKDGETLFTTAQGNKLSKVDGVPQIIQDYLGLCVTDSVYLNYQTCEEKLPLVDYKGSENYQMLHEVLRMEEIFRASNMINADKNALNAEIAEMEVALQRDEVLIEKCGDVTKEFIDAVNELEVEAQKTESKKKSLEGMLSLAEKCDSVKEIPELSKVDYAQLGILEKAMGYLDSIERLRDIPELKKVEYQRYNDLSSMLNMLGKIESLVSTPEVKKIDNRLIARYKSLSPILDIFVSCVGAVKECRKIDKALSDEKAKLNALVEQARGMGLELVRCENCGCYTVVGGNDEG